jgi:hypothetical protein
MAAGLAMTAAALVAAAGPGDTGRAGTQPQPQDHPAAPRPAHPAPELVTAPVRIADVAAVQLLHPGDHVDVVATDPPGASGPPHPRVVAAGARVIEAPEAADDLAGTGALLLLSVPRPTAIQLAGAGATSRLAVTLC